MKTKKYIGLLSLLIISCSSANLYEEEAMQGVFVQKGYEGIQLRLNKNSFLFIDTNEQEHLPPYDCCDTLSYGKWKMDERGFLTLSSHENLGAFKISNSVPSIIFEMYVSETVDFSKDSLYFLINNPIEKFYKKNNRITRDIKYSLVIHSNNNDLNDSVLYKKYSTNEIVIAKSKNLKLSTFDLTVFIDCEIDVKNLTTRKIKIYPYHEVKNPKANVFKIDIPELSFGFLSYKRMNGDYIKIINKNKLLWDGKEYNRL